MYNLPIKTVQWLPLYFLSKDFYPYSTVFLVFYVIYSKYAVSRLTSYANLAHKSNFFSGDDALFDHVTHFV